jgi:hypothetical protein
LGAIAFVHADQAVHEVHVVPQQREQFAATKTGNHGRQVDRGILLVILGTKCPLTI